jgi:hypothetical protein
MLCIRKLCIYLLSKFYYQFKEVPLLEGFREAYEKLTIIQRQFKHHHYEAFRRKRQNVWL